MTPLFEHLSSFEQLYYSFERARQGKRGQYSLTYDTPTCANLPAGP